MLVLSPNHRRWYLVIITIYWIYACVSDVMCVRCAQLRESKGVKVGNRVGGGKSDSERKQGHEGGIKI